ncbi:hypothetical protein [Solidesulfovibrio sp. C21]|uniref:hypothetical protein n=1 Tax=Solidesulfovibrio sp. C21 TaxID=3398613 RepID=UPI0039FDAB1F
MASLLLPNDANQTKGIGMKKLLMGTVLALTVLASAMAYAQNGLGSGPWWMDGDDAPQGVAGSLAGTCLGTGTPTTGLGLGLGLGYGDGTQPQPLDGTGFGSPWAQ